MQNFDRTIPTAFAQFLLGKFKVQFSTKIFNGFDRIFELKNGETSMNPILSTYCRLVNRDHKLHNYQETNLVSLSLFWNWQTLKSAERPPSYCIVREKQVFVWSNTGLLCWRRISTKKIFSSFFETLASRVEKRRSFPTLKNHRQFYWPKN